MECNNNFAFVHFIEDGERLIVPMEDIKFKKPEIKEALIRNSGEINSEKVFKVKFTDGYYYKARIILVGETKEAVQRKIDNKRVRIPPARFEDENGNSTTDDSFLQNKTSFQKQKNKLPKKNLQVADSENYNNILKDISFARNSTVDTQTTDIAKLMEKLSKMEKEIASLKTENKLLAERTEELTTLNLHFQREFFDKWKELAEGFIKHQTSQNEAEENPSVACRRDDNIHLGRGVWIAAHLYDSADMKGKNDTKFVRDLAVSLFGTRVLAQSSVTGTISNRTKSDPKPALDPRKVMAIQDIVRHRMEQRGDNLKKIDLVVNNVFNVISQKIQDINRGPRVKKTQMDMQINGNEEVTEYEVEADGTLIHVEEADENEELV